MATTLQTYINAARRLLKDANGAYWSNADLTAWASEAMQKVAVDAGHHRFLIVSQVVASQRDYPVTFPTPLPTVAGTVGFQQIIGFYDMWVIATGGPSGTRMRLRQPGWQALQAFTNQWTTAIGIPEAWQYLGATQFSLGPMPSLSYYIEFGCKLIPNPLVNLTDADPASYPFDQPVPYYMAYLAKIQQQQYQEAMMFYNRDPQKMGLYQERLLEAIQSKPDILSDIYGTDGELPWGWVRG